MAELGEEVLQVVRRGLGGFLGIQPLIHPAVHPEPVPAAGLLHELPEPLGARPGHGHRIEAALDHGGEGQIFRQPFLPEHLTDHVEIAARPVQPAAHHLAPGARLKTLEEALHRAVHLDGIRRQVHWDGLPRPGVGEGLGPRVCVLVGPDLVQRKKDLRTGAGRLQEREGFEVRDGDGDG